MKKYFFDLNYFVIVLRNHQQNFVPVQYWNTMVENLLTLCNAGYNRLRYNVNFKSPTIAYKLYVWEQL